MHTTTLHIYIEREKGDGSPSQLSTEALHTTTLHIYKRERERREMDPQSIEHRGLAYHYTAYI